MESIQWTFAHISNLRHEAVRGVAHAHERGEGVISSAIAVLIVASIGALMWVGFQQLWERTEVRTNEQVERIGS